MSFTSMHKQPATRFLSATRAAELIARHGLLRCLGEMATCIEEDFRRWPSFDKSARVASHSQEGVIELMPVSDGQLYAFKYVNGHPKNYRYNLPTVMAFGVLAEVDSGLPIMISELTLVTALRTAAASALAAKYLVTPTLLSAPQSGSMAVIGNGAQSEFQILAFHHLLGLRHFHLYDIDPAATDKLMHNLRHHDLKLQRFSDCHAAVKGCDIVTTVTADKANATILKADMLSPGMHINAVGGDCPGKTELQVEVLQRARIFVEYEPQTRIEGDIQQLPADHPVTELWTVITGQSAGRTSPQEITVFDSVGFALEDFSALRYMYDLAEKEGVRETITLIPQLDNPKDLFGFVPQVTAAPIATPS